MKLIDLLSVISEDTYVAVWKDGEVVGTFDGKDSIDTKFNDYEVKSVGGGAFGGRIDIEI